MNHQGTKPIETDRLILRLFTMADADAMYQNWASDEAVTKYLTWPTHSGPDITKRVLQSWVSSNEQKDFYQWAIVLKTMSPEPIGSIAVVSCNEDLNSAEIGYCLGRRWWNMGIATEALQAVMDFLFDAVGVNRVEARHDTRNPASGAVMGKCAMRYEGTMRQADRNNQGICDVSQYAILRQDLRRCGK